MEHYWPWKRLSLGNRRRQVALTFACAVGFVGSGCGSRSVGSWGNENQGEVDAGNPGGPDAGRTECRDFWDCNPGVTCGELTMCEAGECRPDLGHVIIPCTIGECTLNEDCVVAMPMSCCWGCPQVVSREGLADVECFYEDGYPPAVIPVECDVDCLLCHECVPQPLGARCDNGQCVPTDLGCPTMSDNVPAITTAEVVQNPAAYDGQRRWIRGVVIPGEGSCDGEGCTEQYDSMINGVVRLEGYLCNLTVDLIGDECRANLRDYGVRAGGFYEFEGIVHDDPSPYEPPWLEVEGARLVEPQGLGGRYEVAVTGVVSDADDPTCVPPPWYVGQTFPVFLAQSGPQVIAAAPVLHCEANYTGGFDQTDPDRFVVSLPMICDYCDSTISGTVTGGRLVGQYDFIDGTCLHTVFFEGPRNP